jgi:hypothetical protein
MRGCDMDNRQAWDIVIAEVEGECRLHARCDECPLEQPCEKFDEQPFETLKIMKGALYRAD